MEQPNAAQPGWLAIENTALRPDRTTTTAIDSLTVDDSLQPPRAVFLIFKLTLAQRHGLKTDGLSTAFTEAHGQDPVSVFLVPASIAAAYSVQALVPPKAPYTGWKRCECAMRDQAIYGTTASG
ncbi:hypothetical protein FN846DRAFT_909325 [Sphaerosporella brunnea]|uniref:Uncharacterized protein n=1 Tax=Sphaerosporella brunnea TaxID=1250544 RepID=A0A5J5ER49_9PEZI|nr:hypothetical protein FN846DRAFT_909325 [Sphaerosporella brunnea]